MPQRYEQEIEELLEKLRFSSPPQRPRGFLFRLKFWNRLRPRRVSLPQPGGVMTAAYFLVVLSFFLRYSLLTLSKYLTLAGATVFLIAYVVSFIPLSSPRPRYRKTWRGRQI